MRSYDTIIARLILASMIGVGLAGFILFFNLFISTMYQIYNLKQERTLIHSHLDELQSSGMQVFRKKYERLLYSRDVADLPKIARLGFNFNTLAIVQPTIM